MQNLPQVIVHALRLGVLADQVQDLTGSHLHGIDTETFLDILTQRIRDQGVILLASSLLPEFLLLDLIQFLDGLLVRRKFRLLFLEWDQRLLRTDPFHDIGDHANQEQGQQDPVNDRIIIGPYERWLPYGLDVVELLRLVRVHGNRGDLQGDLVGIYGIHPVYHLQRRQQIE